MDREDSLASRGFDTVMNRTNAKELPSPIYVDASIAQIEREATLFLRRAEAAIANQTAAERLVRSGYLLLTELETGGPLGIAALADATRVDVSTASRQIVPLERRGLVRRLTNPADGRGSLAEITQHGLDRLRSTREERHAVFLDLVTDWSEGDRAAFATYLARLNQAILDREAVRVSS